VPWNREHFSSVMAERKQRGETRYGPAYVIHADNRKNSPYADTASYQAAEVFKPLWRDREFLRPTLARYWSRLGELHGMGGGFMPAQVIADLKYVEPLRSASDWMTFAVSGPGSRRGLTYVVGRPPESHWTERDWRAAFDRVREAITPELERAGIPDLHAQDLQNCLCEYAKYERARRGSKLKRRFSPAS
jgi:5-hmdU DNA kinase, helical domain